MTRVLVIGATGMLGHVLCRKGAKERIELWATARTPWHAAPRLAGVIDPQHLIGHCNITEETSVRLALAQARPGVVINCAGVIKQRREAADTEQMIAVNALAPHRLARLTEEVGARLIHISTDCVFSGARGGYREDDVPDASDLYGRSKLLGEVGAPHLTLRTSMIGWQLSGAEGLAEWFRSRGGLGADGWSMAVFSGLTTYALADVILGTVLSRSDLTGLYHVASHAISKLELLRLLNTAMNLGVDLREMSEPRIDRSLDATRFNTTTGYVPPGWEHMIGEMCRRREDYDHRTAQ